MPRLVKLTLFTIHTDWEGGTPTNTEQLSDVYVNPQQVQIIQVRGHYVPQKGDDVEIPKVLITFGTEMGIYVNEPIEEVLKLLDITQGI